MARDCPIGVEVFFFAWPLCFVFITECAYQAVSSQCMLQ